MDRETLEAIKARCDSANIWLEYTAIKWLPVLDKADLHDVLNDIPALIAEVDRLKRERDAAREESELRRKNPPKSCALCFVSKVHVNGFNLLCRLTHEDVSGYNDNRHESCPFNKFAGW